MDLFGIGQAAGSTISGGMSLAGSLLSDITQRENINKQLAFQRETQQNAIKWRVKDAQDAGIHPLFALGASTPTSFPVAMDTRIGEGLSDMGQGIGTAVTRLMDTQNREKHQLDMALGHAQLEESDARKEMYLSEAAKNRQVPAAPLPGLGVQREGQIGLGGPIDIDGQSYDVPGTGAIDLQPVEQASHKEGFPEVVAGEHPFYQEYNYRGMPFLMPTTQGESPEEILSEMSFPAYLGLLMLNKNVYGGNWLGDFVKARYGGKTTNEHYPSIKDQKRMGRYHYRDIDKIDWKQYLK